MLMLPCIMELEPTLLDQNILKLGNICRRLLSPGKGPFTSEDLKRYDEKTAAGHKDFESHATQHPGGRATLRVLTVPSQEAPAKSPPQPEPSSSAPGKHVNDAKECAMWNRLGISGMRVSTKRTVFLRFLQTPEQG